MGSNFLNGSIPKGFFDLPNISKVSLHDNLLSGGFDEIIGDCVNLWQINLSNNQLSGKLPANTGTELQTLFLQSNKLNGTIPTNFSKCDSLKYLDLSDNQLEGVVPKSLSNCRSLKLLNLGNNKLTDKFPSWLDNLQQLQVFSVRFNSFYGPIISSSKVKRPFPLLQIIDLSNNKFSGKLPRRYIKKFAAMHNMNESTLKSPEYMDDLYRTFSIVLTFNGLQLKYEKLITTMSIFDMSNNNFVGQIPDTMGRLQSLRNLNLSHNLFTGNIPPSIGNLSLLNGLDLSSNRLVGHIPQELGLGEMPTKAGIVEDPFKDEGGAKPQNMLFGQPWWHGLSNNGVSPTSASNDSSARSSSGEPVNGSALAGNFSVPLNGIQDAGGNAGNMRLMVRINVKLKFE
ncbi:receptor-like protein 18 [Beta vulgaris subsp. vulgaris]|uniref:receptor-like protein 18 n=1 Tax=Beta vulgaris subsp. vulgaris TaxID=3555 RepID=UPI002036D9C1|nr:receptor-like protein 18 [Beta vulgaris subsp. vulgaris]